MSRAAASSTPSMTLPAPPEADLAAIALFLDVDGTLVDFAARPHEVVVVPELPRTLERLRVRLGGALAPVSGRPLDEIDALLGLAPAAAAGLHGAELRDAQGALISAPGDHPHLDAARALADRAAADIDGLLVEDKGSALALHYRNAPAAGERVERVAETMLAAAGGDYTLLRGNAVVEIKPAHSNKGRALAALMRTPPFAGRRPWMIGDDVTDEDAFAEANARGGVSVIVGPRRPTAARHAFEDPAATRAWIASLAARGRDRGAPQ